MFNVLVPVWLLATTTLFLAGLLKADKHVVISRILSIVSAVLFAVLGLLIWLLAEPSWWWLIPAEFFQSFNAARLAKNIVTRPDIQASAIVTYWKLLGLNLLVCLLIFTSSVGIISTAFLTHVLEIAVLVVSVVFLLSVIYHLFHSRLKRLQSPKTIDLPSVSLLIPARNEDHALTEALNSALAIEYPKLEIIVLDDCSQDQTSEIIKDYAHSGVRFIAGTDPGEDWIGKNHALYSLAEEASGEYLVFADVDVRLGSQSLTQILRMMAEEQISMASVIPRRRGINFWSSLLPIMTKAWLLLIPSQLWRNPTADGSFMVIKKLALQRIGGFEETRNLIAPELWLAKRFSRWENYRLVISDARLDITTRKRFSSILETGVRLSYPLFGSDPANTLLILLGLIGLLTVMVLSIASSSSLALLAAVSLIAANVLLAIKTRHSHYLLAFINLPLVLLTAIYIQLHSMVAYEFFQVRWKQRNVCYPLFSLPEA